jgi:hypothetical protein
MPIKAAESNKAFRYATSFDMSSSTSLSLKFTSPTGIVTTLTDATTPAVTAPALAITDADLGALAASTYMEFKTLATTFTEAGVWKVIAKYTDTATNPDSIYIGDVVTFTVAAGF